MLSSACCNISTSFFLLKVYNSDQLILQIYTGMFRLGFAFENCKRILKPLLPNSVEQIRTTYILKRRFPLGLDKKNRPPKPLKSRHHVYDLVENTVTKKEPDLKLILTTMVDGIGLKNDVVSVRPNFGRNKLLLPGLAVYASPENLEALKRELSSENRAVEPLTHSSRFSELTRRDLAQLILNVLLSQENEWTIEKYHIRSAFRRTGFWVPDHAIKMGERTISGPNIKELEKKIFLVNVTINNLETTPVRCMIRHWSTLPENRLPHKERYMEPPYDALFEDEKEIINKLPLPSFCAK